MAYRAGRRCILCPVSFVSEFKEKLGLKMGERRLSSLPSVLGGRKGISLPNVLSVHVLFHAPTIESWKQLQEVMRILRETHGIPRVTGVAYTPLERAETPTKWYTTRGVELHTAEDVDWRFEPNVVQSSKKEVDVLLDLNLDEALPLLFEAKAARAKFRVGPHRKKEWVRYDFMLESCSDALDFAKSALHYMNTLQLK